ncbi:MAG: hypothetical protein RLZ12_756 [Bacillota bacterium]
MIFGKMFASFSCGLPLVFSSLSLALATDHHRHPHTFLPPIASLDSLPDDVTDNTPSPCEKSPACIIIEHSRNLSASPASVFLSSPLIPTSCHPDGPTKLEVEQLGNRIAQLEQRIKKLEEQQLHTETTKKHLERQSTDLTASKQASYTAIKPMTNNFFPTQSTYSLCSSNGASFFSSSNWSCNSTIYPFTQLNIVRYPTARLLPGESFCQFKASPQMIYPFC